MNADRLLLRFIGKASAFVLFFIAMTAMTAQAQDVCYVDTGGNDGNNGQAATVGGGNGPKATISACVGVSYIADGDTISVEAGQYDGDIVDFTKDVIVESRQTGSFTQVRIDDGIIINGDVTFRANTLGNFSDGVFLVGEGAGTALDLTDGSLTIQDEVTDGRFRIPDGATIERDDDTSVSGTITFQGTVSVTYTDDSSSNTNVTAGNELPADLDGGTLTVNIGGSNTVTLAQETTVSNANVVSGSEIVGSLAISGGGSQVIGKGTYGDITINGSTSFASEATISGNVTVNDDLTYTSATTVEGTLDINNGGNVDLGTIDATVGAVTLETGGTLAINTQTLTIDGGGFSRTGGTFTSGAAGHLSFTGDDEDATFEPGPNFSVSRLTVDKDDATLTVTNDFNVTSYAGIVLSVVSGTTLDIGGQAMNITNAGGVDVDGTLESTTTGALVFTSGASVAGTLRGDGTYSNILINAGSNSDVAIPTGESIDFAGILTLNNGGIHTSGGSADISPSGSEASVFINVAGTGTDITTSGGGTFNNDDVSYSIEYSGVLAPSVTTGIEFSADDIINADFNITSQALVLDHTDETISGNFTLGEGAKVNLDAGFTLTVGGTLTVGAGATLGGGAVGEDFILSANDGSHSVVGQVSAASVLTVTGSDVTITGDTDTDNRAELGSVEVGANAGLTITDIQVISGAVTTLATSTLDISLVEEQDITGNVNLGGTSVTLSSDVDLLSAATITAGTITFDGNDLTMAGAFAFAGSANVVYESSGGALIFTTTGATVTTAGEVLPYLTVNADADIDLAGDVDVGTMLTEDGTSEIDLAGNDLEVSGAIDTDGGTFLVDTGTGTLTLNTLNLTLDTDGRINADVTITDGESVTILPAGDENTLTVSAATVTLAGSIDLGENDLQIVAGNFVNSTGSIAATTGVLNYTSSGGDIAVDGELTIPNLTISSSATLGGSTNGDLTVTGNLVLNAAFNEADSSDDLVIGDGATVTIGVATPLADEPTFNGAVNLTYNVVTNSGEELPDEGEGTVTNMTVANNTSRVVLQQDVTVNGTLTLASVADNETQSVDLVLADGATLRLEADNAAVLANADITATNYSLVYAGGNDTIGDDEFIDGASVTLLEVDLAASGNSITLDKDRASNDVTLSNGSFNLSTSTFNVEGDFTVDGGDLTATSATLAFTADTTAQTISLDGDLVLSGADVKLAKESGIVTLTGTTGATLDFRSQVQELLLEGGILQTDANTDIELYQDANTQGFTQTLADGETSHVAGNVTKRVMAGDPFGDFSNGEGTTVSRSARYEFPTGTSGADGSAPEYRPFAVTFRQNIATTTNLTINHEGQDPQGTVGLPAASGDVNIGNYPDYYWLVDASTSLGQSQLFDVELTATEIGIPFEDEEDLRIIRRFDGSATTNAWNVQGDAGNYDNFLSVGSDDDTTAVARVTDSKGGIVTAGARFTLGIPTRVPVFEDGDGLANGFPADTLVVAEGDTLEFDFDADPRDIGETITYSLENAPDNASIDEDSGEFTFLPDFTQAGLYDITVIANDGTDQVSDQFQVDVTNANRAPVFASVLPDTTADNDVELSFQYEATDADGDSLGYGLIDAPAGAAIDTTSGLFTWTPTFDQVGAMYDIVVDVTDGEATVRDSAVVSVGTTAARGDVNNDGQITPADASLVLGHVVGDTTLTAAAQFAAEVSGNGSVGAFDAGLILQCIAENGGLPVEDPSTCNFPADNSSKAGFVATADIGWGEARSDEGGNVIVPLRVSGNVSNVYSVELTGDMDMSLVNLRSVQGQLPQGWQLAWNADKETGKIRVAAVGGTPISDEGTVAELVFELQDAKAQVDLQGEARVNDNTAAQLGSMAVAEVPNEFALGDNYPNPFNPTTTFEYGVPEAAHVTIEVYDVSGRLVQTLVDAEMEAGRYEVRWDGRSNAGSPVASGLYMYRMRADSFTKVKTMMLVK